MFIFIFTILIVCIYTLFFCTIGLYLQQKLRLGSNYVDRNYYSKLGSAFFIGYIFFLSSWVLLEKIILNAKNSLFIITFIAVVLIWLTYTKKESLFLVNYKQLLITFSVLTIVVSLGFIKAIIPMPGGYLQNSTTISPFAGFGGVVHSFRAGNLSNFIVTENYFPKINQHSGQSIIASIPIFITNQSPQLPLILWLNIFISFFMLLIYGFSRNFISNPLLASIPLLFVLLGNTVLSPIYSSITDTESALMLVSNIDSLFGITSFFLLLIYTFEFIYSKKYNSSFILLLALTGFIWNIISGQMNGLFCVVLIFLMYSQYKKVTSIKLLAITFVSFLLSTMVGAIVIGGMLLPSMYNSNIGVPGLMMLQRADSPTISLRSPRTSENSVYQNTNLLVNDTNLKQPGTTGTHNTKNKFISTIKNNQFTFTLAKLIRSIQLVFFPLLGLVLLSKLLRTDTFLLHEQNFLKYLFSSSILLFCLGWAISSIFNIYGYTWELSKFFYIGSFLTMFILGLSLIKYYKKETVTFKKISLVLLALFIITGPSINYVTTISNNMHNFYNSKSELAFYERLNFLIYNKIIFGNK